MREYNNQDIKSNEAELDPCIAAEIRMKKALFSQRTRRSLLILCAVITSLVLLTVILVFLLSKSSKRTATLLPATNTPREARLEDYRQFEGTIAASSTSATTRANSIFSETTAAGSETRSDDELLPKAVEVRDDAFIEEDDELSSESKPTNVDATVPESYSPTSAATSKEAAETSPFLVQSTGSTLNNSSGTSNNNSGTSTSTIPPPVTSAAKLATPAEPTTAESEDGRELITPATFVNSDDNEAEDCKSLLAQGKTENGIYQISLPKTGKFDVLCDMKTDGGGWTVIQKRQDETVYFANRTWTEYENGFGELKTSFWLGLNKIYALVEKDGGRPATLRIELRGDFCEDKNGCSKQPDGYWWGEWDFKIGDASQKYALSISPASAGNLSERTTTDRFHYMNNGKPFTTIDRDNDKFQGNCAQFRDFGGWWHNDCGYVALNGRYGDRSSKMRNMFWFYGSGTRPFINYYIKPRQSEMKIRSKS